MRFFSPADLSFIGVRMPLSPSPGYHSLNLLHQEHPQPLAHKQKSQIPRPSPCHVLSGSWFALVRVFICTFLITPSGSLRTVWQGHVVPHMEGGGALRLPSDLGSVDNMLTLHLDRANKWFIWLQSSAKKKKSVEVIVRLQMVEYRGGRGGFSYRRTR